jgi:hypothetical protein
MAARSNALSELTRFWLEARHGCLLTESVPVKVPFGWSDIDFVAYHAGSQPFVLHGGVSVGPRLIVEAKDERDFDPPGKAFGAMLRSDIEKLGELYVPAEPRVGLKFSMLREQHYREAEKRFCSADFDRVFVVHALDAASAALTAEPLAQRRIYFVTSRQLLCDLITWFRAHSAPAALRHTLVGDLVSLLLGYSKLTPQPGWCDGS